MDFDDHWENETGPAHFAGLPAPKDLARAAWDRAATLERDSCAAAKVALDVAMATLEQIATTPRNKGAKRNAYATLTFLRTQLKTANV